MVLMSGLDSIIESLYLEDNLTTYMKKDCILVNPETSFINNKTVIINKFNYPIDYINELLDNGNEVISRFNIDSEIDKKIIIDPYDLRVNFNIIPLGKKVDLINEDLYDKIDHIFELNNMKLYYPKPIRCISYSVKGNLTVVGYLAYQLGYKLNNNFNVKFNNLEVIKLKNGIII